MRRSWFGRERSWLLACGVAGLGLFGCGGKEFASGQGSGASSSGGDSGVSGKSTGGSSGTSGGDQSMAGSGEPGGSGGGLGTGCACKAGQYCRDASKDCFDCAELSRLQFSTPERLDTLSSSNQASHFPRVGETATDLFYSVAGAGMRYTTDFSTSAGNVVAQSTPQDSGPLLTAGVVLSEGDFNFAFDRVTETGSRQLFFGLWQGELLLDAAAPPPFNGGTSDYSIAIAATPTDGGIARAYWMSDRENVGPTLVTALLAENDQASPVTLGVGQSSCAPDEADLTPWVTVDGQTLLFSNSQVDGDCTAGDHKDIYTVLLQPGTGQPAMAPAVPLADVNSDGNDVDPSFSSDLCDLYFASDRDGQYALYRAHRH
jgi:hypothetical protein